MTKLLLSVKTIFMIAFIVITSVKFTFASHIAGAEITYQHISGNQYKVNLNLFVDCNGFDPGATQTVNLESSCGQTASLNVSILNPGGTEISQICPAQIANTVCSGGALPGMWIFKFSGTITLPAACDTWTMSWTVCCRNSAILNLSAPSTYGTYLATTLNSVTDSTDSSPYFTSETIPYVCAGQPVNYICGTVDPDGDSLSFSLVSAQDAGAVNLAYSSGYSATSPIAGIAIDPSTGMLSFTPTTIGSFVVVMLVQEFNSNGNLVGSVMRDIQFKVTSCSNTTPSATAGVISNFSGNATYSGRNIQMCPGGDFAFDVIYTDADVSDLLSYLSNITTVLPGAVITSTGANPLTVHVSWTAPVSTPHGIIPLIIDVRDGACPIIGLQSFLYTVSINQGVYAGADKTICGSQNANLNVVGGTSFAWTVISGPPMVVGTNFSCDTCATVIASPTATTVYQVTSNLSCRNVDTVIVNVLPGFSYNATIASPSACIGQPDQINISGLSAASAGYTFQWSPSSYLNNSTIAGPVATILTSGLQTYTVTVTDSAGCIIRDTVQVNILSLVGPQFSILASDTSVCSGSTIQLTADLGDGTPLTCGMTSAGCTSPVVSILGSGSGANTSSTYPAPYGNWYSTVKQQYLYTVAELNAAGITGGKIDQIDFNVSAINGITTYNNYSISMGCTGLSTFVSAPAGFEGGLYSVFPSQTVSIVAGWNANSFTNAFEWDGASNIIIEVCMNQLAPGPNYTANSITPNNATSNISSIFSFSDAADQCSATSGLSIQTAMMHPQIRFHHCGGSSDSANFVYSWMPAGAVVSPAAQLTNALVASSTTYTLTVTDTSNGCASSASQVVGLLWSNMSISGNVNYAGSPVSGAAELFSYAPGVHMPMLDSVAITGGTYHFLNVAPGNYIIRAIADSILFPLAAPTYYDTAYSWDSADVIAIAPACGDTTVADITMIGSGSLIGSASVTGTITEGAGYVRSPGDPLPGIDVILVNQANGNAIAHKISDHSGRYVFTNIPSGCYRIYVDITGLSMESTYHFCLSADDTLNDLDFMADNNSIFPTNTSVSVSEKASKNTEMLVYPNPFNDRLTIELSLAGSNTISLEIYDLIGKKLLTLANEKKQPGIYKYVFDAAELDYPSGIYFLKLKTGDQLITRKIVLTR